MAKTFTAFQREQQYQKELAKIAKQIEKGLRDLLTMSKDSGIEFYMDGPKKGVITIFHPHLMDDLQAKGDVSDMAYFARKSALVTKVVEGKPIRPAPGDFEKGYILPSVSIELTFK